MSSRGIDGLKALAKNGLRYPYPPFSAFADPAEGMFMLRPGL